MGILDWLKEQFGFKPARPPVGQVRVDARLSTYAQEDEDDEDDWDDWDDEDEDEEGRRSRWQVHAVGNKQKAILQAQAFLAQSPVILDTETTGLTNTDEIIEIACIDIEGNVLFNSLVKPTVGIAEGARAIHGISTTDVADAPGMDVVAPQLLEAVKDRLVLTYNFEFDRRLIRQSLRAVGKRWTKDWKDLRGSVEDHCVMYWYGRFWAGTSRRRISLVNALEQSGIETGPQAHRAVDDCRLALLVLKHMAAAEP